jgi:hypothetical protein
MRNRIKAEGLTIGPADQPGAGFEDAVRGTADVLGRGALANLVPGTHPMGWLGL